MKAHRSNTLSRNRLAEDPVKLGAWLSASHVERPARRNKTGAEKPPAHDSPAGGV